MVSCFFLCPDADCSRINLSNYDAFRKYSVEEIGNMLGIGKTKKFQQYIDLLHKVVSGQEKTPET